MKQISLNFGAIKDSIYRYSSKELVNESIAGEKVNILGSFVNSLKENPTLKIQYLIFKNLEEGYFKKERLAERYINQNLKLLENVSWENIININRDIRIKLLENAHVEGNAGKNELYEAIQTLIESTVRTTYSDIDKSQEAYEFILEHLTKERENKEVIKETEENDNPKFLSWNFITKLAVDNFNKRYAHLNESEQSLLKILLSPEEKKNHHLTDLIKENSEIINNLLEEGVSNKETESALLNFKSKLEKIEGFAKENIDEAIINCSELNETLKDIKK